MSAHRVYIFDTVKPFLYGEKYQRIIKDAVSQYAQRTLVTCFIEKPEVQKSRLENKSAKQISDCDVFLLLYEGEISERYDQVLFAEKAGKKIVQIDVCDYDSHTEIYSTSLPELLSKMELKKQRMSTVTCPGCGEEIDPINGYCPICGYHLSVSELEALKLESLKLPSEDIDPMSQEDMEYYGDDSAIFDGVHSSGPTLKIRGRRKKGVRRTELPTTDEEAYILDHGQGRTTILQVLLGLVIFILTAAVLRYGMLVLGDSFTYVMICVIGAVGVVFAILLVRASVDEKNAEAEELIRQKSLKNFDPLSRRDVFISYKHNYLLAQKNLLFEELIRHCDKNQIVPWYDSELHKHSGSNFNEKIAEAIAECPTFLCMIDKKYVQSEFCLDEFYYARSKNKKIIPVFLEELELSPGMEMRLIQCQRILYYESRSKEDFFAEIISNV